MLQMIVQLVSEYLGPLERATVVQSAARREGDTGVDAALGSGSELRGQAQRFNDLGAHRRATGAQEAGQAPQGTPSREHCNPDWGHTMDPNPNRPLPGMVWDRIMI